MLLPLIVAGTILTAAGDDAPARPRATAAANLAAYEAVRAQAGRDAAAQVRLALWCEAHGLAAERMKHLALAVLSDPANTTARGLMGLVAHQGKWMRPESVGRRMDEDPAYRERVREYLDRRAKASLQAESQFRLATWCEQNGLKEQALAHFSEVVRLDPSREGAWRHLGYRKQGDRWIKPEELAAERLEADRQRRADKLWRPKLERLREALDGKDTTHRAKAEQAVAEVTDSRAVPTIWSVLGRGGERSRLAAIQMLGQIDGPAASHALAALALFHPSAGVRGRAIESLARRDPRDVIGRMIPLLRRPFRYEVRRPGGPGTVGEVFVEGERFNIRRYYTNPPVDFAAIPPRLFAPSVPFDPFSVQNLILVTAAFGGATVTTSGSVANAAQVGQAIAAHPQNAPTILQNLAKSQPGAAPNPTSSLVFDTLAAAAYRDMEIASTYQNIQQAAQDLQHRLAQDIRMVETTNGQINELNGRVLPVLKLVTGRDLGVDPERWRTWWLDQLGSVSATSPTGTSNRKPTYTDMVSVQAPFIVGASHTACFAAGTKVLTLDGPRAIESIRVGDRVLSQSSTTGRLSFQPVIATHRNEPSPTLRLAIDDEAVVATGIHRFWKAGKGWTMARDLKPGDRIRTIAGTAAVRAIRVDSPEPVYNLDVAGDRDFFVGTQGLLVHDFSFVQPVLEPFDRPLVLESSRP